MNGEPARGSPLPFVSVIIPVYNNPDGLRRCLHALEAQTYPKSRYEIIVVDNGSDTPPADMVRAFDRVTLLEEAVPSSYAARNRGLAQARGEVIAFTDSDCIPAPDWLAHGVANL